MFIKYFSKNNKEKGGPASDCSRQDGYTIIETMISVSLFLIVVTAGMGALLQANLLHQKSQDMRSILDSMSFIMEEMSRNLRTGTNFHCTLSGTLTVPQSCASGREIVFEVAGGSSTNPSDQWIYKIDISDGSISKSTDAGASWTPLNPTEVRLTSASGFSVLGPEAPSGNTQQPLVTIRLVGNITYKTTVTPFSFQTSVSQRVVDN